MAEPNLHIQTGRVEDRVIALCVDVAGDGVYCGKEWPIRCVRPGWNEPIAHCQARGCFWRKFHQLPPRLFARPVEQKEIKL